MNGNVHSGGKFDKARCPYVLVRSSTFFSNSEANVRDPAPVILRTGHILEYPVRPWRNRYAVTTRDCRRRSLSTRRGVKYLVEQSASTSTNHTSFCYGLPVGRNYCSAYFSGLRLYAYLTDHSLPPYSRVGCLRRA